MIHRKDYTYEELRQDYIDKYSLGRLNLDINTKFALISLIGYITMRIKFKKPEVTYYQVVRQLLTKDFSDIFCKSLAVVCEDFSYGCTQFPTFGINDKDIPSKIREILSQYIPF
jgi:hypothetical protein